MKSLRIFVSLCILPSLCFTACQPDQDDRPRIAIVMKSLANEFFATMEQGAREHQRENPDQYRLIVNGIRDESDVGRQMEIVEQMIAQRVDAIIIAPADSKALIPVARRAARAGIVVVNIDNKFDQEVLAQNDITFPFVGPNNRAGARAVGAYLAQYLAPGDPVAIIEGAPNAYNAVQRRLGFEDAMKEAGARIVSSQSGFWETDQANRVAASIINEHPDLKAILCANDSMALGAISALRAAGKIAEVRVVGYDNIAAARQLIQEGRMLATVDQHADQLAVFGIEYALKTLGAGDSPADQETPVDLVTADSIAAH